MIGLREFGVNKKVFTYMYTCCPVLVCVFVCRVSLSKWSRYICMNIYTYICIYILLSYLFAFCLSRWFIILNSVLYTYQSYVWIFLHKRCISAPWRVHISFMILFLVVDCNYDPHLVTYIYENYSLILQWALYINDFNWATNYCLCLTTCLFPFTYEDYRDTKLHMYL